LSLLAASLGFECALDHYGGEHVDEPSFRTERPIDGDDERAATRRLRILGGGDVLRRVADLPAEGG
jgi:hypothetical protein